MFGTVKVPETTPVADAVTLASDSVRPPQLRFKATALLAVKPVPEMDTEAAGAAFVGVKVRVVGVVTLKVPAAVATCDPLDVAAAEMVQIPVGDAASILNCVVYVPAGPVVAMVVYLRVPAESVTCTLTSTPAAATALSVTAPLIVTNAPLAYVALSGVAVSSQGAAKAGAMNSPVASATMRAAQRVVLSVFWFIVCHLSLKLQ